MYVLSVSLSDVAITWQCSLYKWNNHLYQVCLVKKTFKMCYTGCPNSWVEKYCSNVIQESGLKSEINHYVACDIWPLTLHLCPVRWLLQRRLWILMWTSTQWWPTCLSSPKPSSSLVPLCDLKPCTPREPRLTGQVRRIDDFNTLECQTVSMRYNITSTHTSAFLNLSVGIEPRGNVVLRPAEFVVETVEAGLGEVLVYIEDPEGHTEEVIF